MTHWVLKWSHLGVGQVPQDKGAAISQSCLKPDQAVFRYGEMRPEGLKGLNLSLKPLGRGCPFTWAKATSQTKLSLVHAQKPSPLLTSPKREKEMQKHHGWLLQTCSGCNSSQHIDVQKGFQPQPLLTSRAM